MNLHFLKEGFHTLVQDRGRLGLQANGIPIGGPMDRTSAWIANWLAGNRLDGPVLEITLIGPEIAIEGEGQIAITGAQLNPKLNRRDIPPYQTINVKDGDILSFGAATNGCRSYLSVSGEWGVSEWMGSVSASINLPNGLTSDSIIKKGRSIKVTTRPQAVHRIYPKQALEEFQDRLQVDAVSGPDIKLFSKATIESFFSTTFKIGQDSNRMGYKLMETVTDYTSKIEIISSGVVPGTIQITNSGQPIILMADAQTSGGYPRIACVATSYLDSIAQLKPGDQIQFREVNLKESVQSLKDQQNSLKLLLN